MVRLKLWRHCGVDKVSDDFHAKVNQYFSWCKNNKQKPILDFYPEGYDLVANNAWPFIQHCMDLYELEPTIVTADWHANYDCKTIKCQNFWMQTVPNPSLDFVKNIEKKFGHFIGRITWDRLVMHDLILKTPDDVIYTFWSSIQRAGFVMQALEKINNIYGFSSLKDYHSIIMHLPSTNTGLDLDVKHLTSYPENTLRLQNVYQKIFCDIVHETDINNNNCFYTEKTTRPILFKTPFITMHGKGSLKSLKTIGFKTFDSWWPEHYDDFHGVQRLQEVCKVIDQIRKLDYDEIKTIAKEMEDVLQYNQEYLLSREWQKKMHRLGVKFWYEDGNEF